MLPRPTGEGRGEGSPPCSFTRGGRSEAGLFALPLPLPGEGWDGGACSGGGRGHPNGGRIKVFAANSSSAALRPHPCLPPRGEGVNTRVAACLSGGKRSPRAWTHPHPRPQPLVGEGASHGGVRWINFHCNSGVDLGLTMQIPSYSLSLRDRAGVEAARLAPSPPGGRLGWGSPNMRRSGHAHGSSTNSSQQISTAPHFAPIPAFPRRGKAQEGFRLFLHQPGPRNRLCRAAGAASPRGAVSYAQRASVGAYALR